MVIFANDKTMSNIGRSQVIIYYLSNKKTPRYCNSTGSIGNLPIYSELPQNQGTWIVPVQK